MNLSKADKAWLSKEISGQLNSLIDSLRPRGWKRLTHWLREWGIVGTNIAIIVALLGLSLTAAGYAFSRVGKEAAFEARTEAELKQIEAALKLIPIQVSASNLSSLPVNDLPTHKPELAKFRQTLTATDRNTPNFWPTSFQVINLLSKATSPVKVEHPSAIDLTDSTFGPGAVDYPPGSVISLHKHIYNSTFKDAVIYLDANVILQNVTFINCTIVLPAVEVPSAPLQQVGNQLLEASDFSHLVLTSS